MGYTYFSHGSPKSLDVNGQIISTMLYDEHARQTSLWEPNSDTTKYNYNTFGELIFQDDSRDTILPTQVAFDVIGRVDSIIQHEGIIQYSYHDSGDGLNQISEIINYNGYQELFAYDTLDRILSHTEIIEGQSFPHLYSYTAFDQLDKVTYPSNLEIGYEYYSNTGFLKRMKDVVTDATLYEPKESNKYGQMTEYLLGNGLTSTIEYDKFGILDRISASNVTVFDMSFDFNIQNGLLNQRTDHSFAQPLTENFLFDDFYRLTQAQVMGQTADTISYNANGNIQNKSDVSNDDYLYDADKIHAVVDVPSSDTSIIPTAISYNSAHQPTDIIRGDKTLVLGNGSDEQRRYTALSDNGQIVEERFFCNSYEKQEENGITRQIHYLDAGIIAIKEDSDPIEYFYTYGDYLGSILSVTDDQGTVVGRQSFDAWGRERSAMDWTDNISTNIVPPWLYRGYTSHEMLPSFNLINMNGRLYDSKLGRMLSIDNYSGQDGSSQSFNRYSYVLNNPLMYTDPDGENPYGNLQCDVCTPLPIDAGGAAGSAGVTALGHGLAKLFDFGNDNYFQVGGNDGIIVNGVQFKPYIKYEGDDPFVKDVFQALNYILDENADVFNVIDRLAYCPERVVFIKENPKRNTLIYKYLEKEKVYAYTPLTDNGELIPGVDPYVVWDPNLGLVFGEKYNALIDDSQGTKGYRTPAESLLHELAHVLNFYLNPELHFMESETFLKGYDNYDEYRVQKTVENPAAEILKRNPRNHHRGTLYQVESPVSTKPK